MLYALSNARDGGKTDETLVDLRYQMPMARCRPLR